MIKHYNISIKGRVQGVGFRYHTKKKAFELGIKGFVKNKVDRSVYIEAEAEEDKLLLFINWCEKGPDWAYVETIHHSQSPVQNYSTFDIR